MTGIHLGCFLPWFIKGSYVFMDADYGKNLDASGNFVKDFAQSLYVLGTIQSVTVSQWFMLCIYMLIT